MRAQSPVLLKTTIDLKNKSRSKLVQTRDILDKNERLLREELKKLEKQKNSNTQEAKKLNFNIETLKTLDIPVSSSVKINESKERNYYVWGERFLRVIRRKSLTMSFEINLSEETKSTRITSVCHSDSNLLYFVCTQEFKIHVFNEHTILIKQFQTGYGEISASAFIDSQNLLILAGANGIFILKMTYDQANPIITTSLDPLGQRLQIEFSLKKWLQAPLWLKEIRYGDGCDSSSPETLMVWNNKQVSFLRVSTMEIYLTVPVIEANLADSIVDVLEMKAMRYFVVATSHAKLLVIKISKEHPLMFEFSDFTSSVQSLQLHPSEPNQFLAMYSDHTLRIYCLKKYALQYEFRLSQEERADKYKVLPNMELMGFTSTQVSVMKLNDVAKLMLRMKASVKQVGACYKDMDLLDFNNPFAIFARTSEGAIMFHEAKPIADTPQISSIYPKEVSVPIKQIQFCTSIKRLFVLLTSGTLLVYTIYENDSHLTKMIKPEDLRDFLGVQIRRKIVCFELCTSSIEYHDCDNNIVQRKPVNYHKKKVSVAKPMSKLVPKQSKGDLEDGMKPFETSLFRPLQAQQNIGAPASRISKVKFGDFGGIAGKANNNPDQLQSGSGSGIFGLKSTKKVKQAVFESSRSMSDEDDSLMTEDWEEENFICLGMTKGQAMFYDVNNFGRLVARYEMAKHDIEFVREMRVKPKQLFVTADSKMDIFLSDITPNGCQLLHQFNIHGPIFNMFARKDNLIVGLKSGDIEVLTAKKRSTRKNLKRRQAVALQSQGEFFRQDWRLMRVDLKHGGERDKGSLTSMAIETNAGLIVTADTRQNVRVTDLNQALLLQVKFANQVGAVGFVDKQGDLMVGHGNTLSLVSKEHFLKLKPKTLLQMSILQKLKQMQKEQQNTDSFSEDLSSDESASFNARLEVCTSEIMESLYKQKERVVANHHQSAPENKPSTSASALAQQRRQRGVLQQTQQATNEDSTDDLMLMGQFGTFDSQDEIDQKQVVGGQQQLHFGPDQIIECQKQLEIKKAAEAEWKGIVNEQMHKLRTGYKYETKVKEAADKADKLAEETIVNHLTTVDREKNLKFMKEKIAKALSMKKIIKRPVNENIKSSHSPVKTIKSIKSMKSQLSQKSHKKGVSQKLDSSLIKDRDAFIDDFLLKTTSQKNNMTSDGERTGGGDSQKNYNRLEDSVGGQNFRKRTSSLKKQHRRNQTEQNVAHKASSATKNETQTLQQESQPKIDKPKQWACQAQRIPDNSHNLSQNSLLINQDYHRLANRIPGGSFGVVQQTRWETTSNRISANLMSHNTITPQSEVVNTFLGTQPLNLHQPQISQQNKLFDSRKQQAGGHPDTSQTIQLPYVPKLAIQYTENASEENQESEYLGFQNVNLKNNKVQNLLEDPTLLKEIRQKQGSHQRSKTVENLQRFKQKNLQSQFVSRSGMGQKQLLDNFQGKRDNFTIVQENLETSQDHQQLQQLENVKEIQADYQEFSTQIGTHQNDQTRIQTQVLIKNRNLLEQSTKNTNQLMNKSADFFSNRSSCVGSKVKSFRVERAFRYKDQARRQHILARMNHNSRSGSPNLLPLKRVLHKRATTSFDKRTAGVVVGNEKITQFDQSSWTAIPTNPPLIDTKQLMQLNQGWLGLSQFQEIGTQKDLGFLFDESNYQSCMQQRKLPQKSQINQISKVNRQIGQNRPKTGLGDIYELPNTQTQSISRQRSTNNLESTSLVDEQPDGEEKNQNFDQKGNDFCKIQVSQRSQQQFTTAPQTNRQQRIIFGKEKHEQKMTENNEEDFSASHKQENQMIEIRQDLQDYQMQEVGLGLDGEIQSTQIQETKFDTIERSKEPPVNPIVHQNIINEKVTFQRAIGTGIANQTLHGASSNNTRDSWLLKKTQNMQRQIVEQNSTDYMPAQESNLSMPENLSSDQQQKINFLSKKNQQSISNKTQKSLQMNQAYKQRSFGVNYQANLSGANPSSRYTLSKRVNSKRGNMGITNGSGQLVRQSNNHYGMGSRVPVRTGLSLANASYQKTQNIVKPMTAIQLVPSSSLLNSQKDFAQESRIVTSNSSQKQFVRRKQSRLGNTYIVNSIQVSNSEHQNKPKMEQSPKHFLATGRKASILSGNNKAQLNAKQNSSLVNDNRKQSLTNVEGEINKDLIYLAVIQSEKDAKNETTNFAETHTRLKNDELNSEKNRQFLYQNDENRPQVKDVKKAYIKLSQQYQKQTEQEEEGPGGANYYQVDQQAQSLLQQQAPLQLVGSLYHGQSQTQSNKYEIKSSSLSTGSPVWAGGKGGYTPATIKATELVEGTAVDLQYSQVDKIQQHKAPNAAFQDNWQDQQTVHQVNIQLKKADMVDFSNTVEQTNMVVQYEKNGHHRNYTTNHSPTAAGTHHLMMASGKSIYK